MSDDKKARSDWGKARRARRAEWSDVREEDIDKRRTRQVLKKQRLHVYLTAEALAMLDAWASRMDYGQGKNRSDAIEYLIREKVRKAREAYREATP